ncbi:MAG: hypothetical protein IKS16_04155 [Lachnospiraceae bacterium]|nr:hypothetical protein [Lachnospiraceae bacterium]
MKLQHDDDEYSGLSVRMPVIILGASLSIFFILALVLATNNSKKKPHAYTATAPLEESASQTQDGEPVDTLRADDLNFWDMYQYGDETDVIDQPGGDNTSRKDILEQKESDMRKAEEEAAEAAAKAAAENADPATDGKHTMVTHIDGTTEWLPINSSLKLNTYENTQFQSQNGIMGYYVNGRCVTKTGVDISQYTTSIDWTALARQADYVMIRVGARGYDTGNIIADTKFIENVTQAAKAGIPFGVYFSSQAINETEAKEEATYVMTQLAAAQSAVAGLGLSTAQTNNNTSNNTSNTATANTTTTQNTTTVPQTLQQKLKGMGLETDPAKYGTTTSVKDTSGNTTTTVVDSKGNTTVTVNDAEGKQISKKTVNLDPYGNVTTVTTDADGTEHVVTEKVSEAAVVADPNTNNTGTATTTTTVTTASPQFKLAYPVAIEMHLITNDISRIEGIDKTARTGVLTAFCNLIETGGYNAMVAANKEFLLCQVNPAPLSKYEIWMANEGNLPDYPYLMSMWKYNTRGKLITGLTGDYGVSVGFIDYSAR